MVGCGGVRGSSTLPAACASRRTRRALALRRGRRAQQAGARRSAGGRQAYRVREQDDIGDLKQLHGQRRVLVGTCGPGAARRVRVKRGTSCITCVLPWRSMNKSPGASCLPSARRCSSPCCICLPRIAASCHTTHPTPPTQLHPPTYPPPPHPSPPRCPTPHSTHSTPTDPNPPPCPHHPQHPQHAHSTPSAPAHPAS